jgi:hypothetical protein
LTIATWAPERRVPLWVKLIGGSYYDGGSVRTRWGEFSPRGWGLALSIGAYETAHIHFMLIWGSVFIKARWLDKFLNADAGPDDTLHYGLTWSWFGDEARTALWLQWGKRSRFIDYPWAKNYVQREFYGADGKWHPNDLRRHSWMHEGEGIEPFKEQHVYHYMLYNGEVQHVPASVGRERGKIVWQWYGQGWLTKLLRRISPSKTKHYIEIEFDGEVGEEAGSWKGGCTACSFEMKPSETIRNALARMQRTRKF